MRLEAIMSVPAKTIAPEATVANARAIFRRDNINHLVVVQGVHPIGVLSARDLLRSDVSTVGEAMSDEIVTASPRTSVREAANLLRGYRLGCLVVVENERVVGIVTVSDLLELIGKGAEKGLVKPTRRDLLGRGRGPRHSVRKP